MPCRIGRYDAAKPELEDEVTDRFNFLTVALEQDIRDDDAQALIVAISLFAGVIKVEGNVVNPNDWIAQQRIRHELRQKWLFEDD